MADLQLHRITSIDDPRFADLHALLRRVFPPEEVLAYEKWASLSQIQDFASSLLCATKRLQGPPSIDITPISRSA